MTHFPSSPAVDSLTASSVRICKEVFDEDFQPSKEGMYAGVATCMKSRICHKRIAFGCPPEITDYARKIGINPEKEPHLLNIAVEGLLKALPDDWKPW